MSTAGQGTAGQVEDGEVRCGVVGRRIRPEGDGRDAISVQLMRDS